MSDPLPPAEGPTPPPVSMTSFIGRDQPSSPPQLFGRGIDHLDIGERLVHQPNRDPGIGRRHRPGLRHRIVGPGMTGNFCLERVHQLGVKREGQAYGAIPAHDTRRGHADLPMLGWWGYDARSVGGTQTSNGSSSKGRTSGDNLSPVVNTLLTGEDLSLECWGSIITTG